MLYFNTLPKILTPDENGNYIALTNLLTRAKLLEDLQDNPMLFYKYSIQDGDTPEIVADKYYGDPYRYWIVLYSNQILDPMWQWPLEYNQFMAYINSKYATEAESANTTPFSYTANTVYEYQKVITTTDSYSDTESTTIVTITPEEYANVVISTETFPIPSGGNCTISITKNTQYIFDYEYELNESRRQIKLMDSFYVGQMEEQLHNVMNK